jgi:hypothetical protein
MSIGVPRYKKVFANFAARGACQDNARKMNAVTIIRLGRSKRPCQSLNREIK